MEGQLELTKLLNSYSIEYPPPDYPFTFTELKDLEVNKTYKVLSLYSFLTPFGQRCAVELISNTDEMPIDTIDADDVDYFHVLLPVGYSGIDDNITAYGLRMKYFGMDVPLINYHRYTIKFYTAADLLDEQPAAFI